MWSSEPAGAQRSGTPNRRRRRPHRLGDDSRRPSRARRRSSGSRSSRRSRSGCERATSSAGKGFSTGTWRIEARRRAGRRPRAPTASRAQASGSAMSPPSATREARTSNSSGSNSLAPIPAARAGRPGPSGCDGEVDGRGELGGIGRVDYRHPGSARISARSSIAWCVALNGVVTPGRNATTIPRDGPVAMAIATWSYARRVANTP